MTEIEPVHPCPPLPRLRKASDDGKPPRPAPKKNSGDNSKKQPADPQIDEYA